MIQKFYKLLYSSTDNIAIQLLRYVFVGGIAFVADFGILALLTELLDVPYLLSGCFGFIGGLTVNYVLSIKWVFNKQTSNVSTAITDFIVFAIIGVIGLGLNALIMWVATEQIGAHYLLSKVISTILVFGWNFIARRVLISQTQNICRLIQTSNQAH